MKEGREFQESLLRAARESLEAARVMMQNRWYGFAASRAYYTMFYLAEAFLVREGLSLSKHSAVEAAFGKHFAKTERVPQHFHRYLIQAMRLRHAGDYLTEPVTQEMAEEQLQRADEFLRFAWEALGGIDI